MVAVYGNSILIVNVATWYLVAQKQAAIQAMQEPTAAMVDSAADKLKGYTAYDSGPSCVAARRRLLRHGPRLSGKDRGGRRCGRVAA